MADGVTTLGGPPAMGMPTAPPSPEGQKAESILSQLEGRSLDPAMKAYDKEESIAQAREDKEFGLQEKERTELRAQRPEYKEPPPPVPVSTDPHVVWSSMAMGMAMLGSLFTRTPLTTAMNAGAAVLQAHHDNDIEAAKTAMATWKQASENAIHLYDYQRKAYDDAMGDIDRREKMTIEERTQADREATARLTATIHQFQDENMAKVLEARGLTGVAQMNERRDAFQEKLIENMPKIIASQQVSEIVSEMYKDDDFLQLNKTDQARAVLQVLQDYGPKGQMTPAQRISAEERIQGEIEKSWQYKAWDAAHVTSGEVQAALADEQKLQDGSIKSLMLTDLFIRTYSGGQAVREFQAAMLDKYKGLWNQMYQWSAWVQHGGSLSPEQTAQIAAAVKDSAQFLTNAVTSQVMQVQARAISEKIDPHNIVPSALAGYAHDNPDMFPNEFSVPKPGQRTDQAAPAGQGKPAAPKAKVTPTATSNLKRWANALANGGTTPDMPKGVTTREQLIQMFDGIYGPKTAEGILGK